MGINMLCSCWWFTRVSVLYETSMKCDRANMDLSIKNIVRENNLCKWWVKVRLRVPWDMAFHKFFFGHLDIIASFKSMIGLCNRKNAQWRLTFMKVRLLCYGEKCGWGGEKWNLILTCCRKEAKISQSARNVQNITGWSVWAYETEGAFN